VCSVIGSDMLLARVKFLKGRNTFVCLQVGQFHSSSLVSSRDLNNFHKKDRGFRKGPNFPKLVETRAKKAKEAAKRTKGRLTKEAKRIKRLKKLEERMQELAKPLEERNLGPRTRQGPSSGFFTPKAEPDEHVEHFYEDYPQPQELESHIEKQHIWQPPRIPDPVKPNPQFIGSGKRKSARVTATIRPGTGKITVNGRHWVDYFKHIYTRGQVFAPVVASEKIGLVDIKLLARGGGVSGQAEAGARAIANAFINGDPEMLYLFRESGMQTGDLRVKERKHTGRRAARKKQAWVKR